MLENKRSRVYCFCAVRSYHRSRRSAPKTRSREARTMTEMGLFCTNRSNTSPSMAASLMTKLKKAYRTQDRHTLTPLVVGPKHHGPLYDVSSMALKGPVRRRQVSKTQGLAERCHGDAQEACIVLRGKRPLTYLACDVSSSI